MMSSVAIYSPWAGYECSLSAMRAAMRQACMLCALPLDLDASTYAQESACSASTLRLLLPS